MCCSPFCVRVVCLLVDLFWSRYWVVLEFGLGSGPVLRPPYWLSCGGSSSAKDSGPFGLPAWESNNGKLLRVSIRDVLDNNGADVLLVDGIKLLVGASGWISSCAENSGSMSSYSVNTICWAESRIGASVTY